jgi:light-regulated signal transduction histidine kinase (bacteriophytochrome)
MVNNLKNIPKDTKPLPKVYSNIDINDTKLCMTVSPCKSKEIYLLDIELLIPPKFNTMLKTGEIVSIIKACRSISEVIDTYCNVFMNLLPNYDRAIAYSFCDDFSCEVFYENIRKDSGINYSFLNHRFPESNVPKVARDLYLINPIRFMTNNDHDGFTVITEDNDSIDLTNSAFRQHNSCARIFYKNMTLKSIITVAIILDGKLWGIIAFHAIRKATFPSLEKRLMLETVANIAGLRIEGILRENIITTKLELSEMVKDMHLSSSIFEYMNDNGKSLLKV